MATKELEVIMAALVVETAMEAETMAMVKLQNGKREYNINKVKK